MNMKNSSFLRTKIRDLFNSISFDEMGKEECIELCVQLVAIFRPSDIKSIVSIRPLIDELDSNKLFLEQFRSVIGRIIENRSFSIVLTDHGILKDARFLSEVSDRIVAKFLPEQADKESLEYLINQIFYKDSDLIWIMNISESELLEFHEQIGFTSIYSSCEDKSSLSQIMSAITLIMQRASGRALETEVLNMVPKYIDLESPFEAFEKEFDLLVHEIKKTKQHWVSSSHLGYKQLNILLKQCYDFVEKAFENSQRTGISIRVNQNLLRIRQQLDRVSVLLPLLSINEEKELNTKTINFSKLLIEYNCTKNNISQLIQDSTATIAYEITKHSAQTGEHYITNDRREYFKMLKAAIGGGVIVGILCILKLLISKLHISELGYAFLYSMNYSIGFVVIYLFGFTLATKQPAMTAAAIVNAIDKDLKNNKKVLMRHAAFANLFSKLFRSQFIAFVGNVIAAFPIAFLGVYLIELFTNYNVAEAKWPKLIHDISPVHSKAIFHASIAGLFLFLSGIISGNIANRHKYKKVIYRIKEHPLLKQVIGKKRTEKLGDWVGKKWPGVASNFWFGVLMGSTAIVGTFIGLDLDIRHITFASGNFSMGLYGSDFDLSFDLIFWVIMGIGVIGFMNFIVSFLLSLTLAMRSRRIPFSELYYLFSSVWLYFKMNPFSFFYPEKEEYK